MAVGMSPNGSHLTVEDLRMGAQAAINEIQTPQLPVL